MEQGLINTTSSSNTGISNLDDVNNQNEYVLTRNNNNQVIATEGQERINSLNTVSQDGEFILTRNNNNQLRVAPAQERIGNLNGIQNNTRYHLTRNNQEVTILEDNSVQIAIPQTGNLVYAVRRQGTNAFTLTRTPALTEYTFFTNSLQNNASFDVLGVRGSRCIHVINTSGLISKFGLLHVTTFRSIGLIDRAYNFEIIHNNINLPLLNISPNNAVTDNEGRSATRDIENLNIFVNQGDCIGVRYVVGSNGRTGDYCQVRITIDANARRNNFGRSDIP